MISKIKSTRSMTYWHNQCSYKYPNTFFSVLNTFLTKTNYIRLNDDPVLV